MKAIIVDKDYGSVTPQELDSICAAYTKAGFDIEQHHFTTDAEIVAGCRDAEIILATGNPNIDGAMMKQMPKLRFIQRFGIGVNSIDVDAATELGIAVLYAPGYCSRELADLATGMILGLYRNLGYYDRRVRLGQWPKCGYYMPVNPRSITLGILGFGNAGRQLHDIFHGGFGSRIIACDPYISDAVKARYPHVEFVDFQTLLKKSDVISIHCNLSKETRHLFDAAAFKTMKNTAMIINTARGPIIDQKALVDALTNGEIRYAGLDTYEVEPVPADDPILKLENVILGPHSGLYGDGAKITQLHTASTLIPEAVNGKGLPAKNVANADVLKKDLGVNIILED